MESIQKVNIFASVNGSNQKVNYLVTVKFYQSKCKYLCLLMKSNNKFIFVPVNGIYEKGNICAC